MVFLSFIFFGYLNKNKVFRSFPLQKTPFLYDTLHCNIIMAKEAKTEEEKIRIIYLFFLFLF